jgi:hypothetical protein
MNASSDLRIPLIRAGAAGPRAPTDAILREGPAAAGGGTDGPNEAWFQPGGAGLHAANCNCCQPRNPAGVAIAALLFAAARGHAPAFQRLVVVTTTPEGAAAIEHALACDPLVRARFKEAVLF